MDLLTIIRIVLRRWYVAVAILGVAAAVAYIVQLATPPQYQATGAVLVEEPRFEPSLLPTSLVNAAVLIDRFQEAGALEEVMAGRTQLVPQVSDTAVIDLLAVGDDASDVTRSIQQAMRWIVSETEAVQDEHEVEVEERLRPLILTPTAAAEEQPDGRFQARGTVALSDPTAGTENPYSAGGATTSVLQAVLSSDAGLERVKERTGPDVSYTLSNPRDNAAIIDITIVGSNRQDVLEGFDVVAAELGEELDSRQARAVVPTSRRLAITDLAAPTTAVDISPPLNRAVAAVLALGGLLALGSAVTLDGILARRRYRSGAAPDAVEPPRASDWWCSDTSPPRHGNSKGSERAPSGPERNR